MENFFSFLARIPLVQRSLIDKNFRKKNKKFKNNPSLMALNVDLKALFLNFLSDLNR